MSWFGSIIAAVATVYNTLVSTVSNVVNYNYFYQETDEDIVAAAVSRLPPPLAPDLSADLRDDAASLERRKFIALLKGEDKNINHLTLRQLPPEEMLEIMRTYSGIGRGDENGVTLLNPQGQRYTSNIVNGVNIPNREAHTIFFNFDSIWRANQPVYIEEMAALINDPEAAQLIRESRPQRTDPTRPGRLVSDPAYDIPHLVRAAIADGVRFRRDFTIKSPTDRNEQSGGFFPFINSTDIDLSRYQLFQGEDKRIGVQCLRYALDLWCEQNKYEGFIYINPAYINNGTISSAKLTKIGEENNIYFNVTSLAPPKCCIAKNETLVTRSQMYPHARIRDLEDEDNIIYLARYKKHYFLNEKTEFTRNDLCYYLGLDVPPTRNNTLSSLHLIDMLMRNGRILDMDFDMINRYKPRDPNDTEVELSTLPFLKSVPCHFAGICPSTHPSDIVFFDFESHTDLAKHNPYCVSFKFNDDRFRTFRGPDCYKQLMEEIGNRATYFEACGDPDCKQCYRMVKGEQKEIGYRSVKLYAHNLRYDASFLVPYTGCTSYLGSTSNCKSYECKWGNVKCQFKDTKALINVPLAKFPGMFGFPGAKEIHPYDLYNEHTVKLNCVPIIDALKFLKPEDREEFKTRVEKDFTSFCPPGYFRHLDYAEFYCERDVEILAEGFHKFRQLAMKGLEIDVIDQYTTSSLSNAYLMSKGVYEGVHWLIGGVRIFIQGTISGGRVGTLDNRKWHVTFPVFDLDAVSLYPSAMVRLLGYLIGAPKLIPQNWLKQKNYRTLFKQDGYFVEIQVLNVPKHIYFPVVSYMDENGVRSMDDSYRGKLKVCKTDLENLMRFQKMKPNRDFVILQGVYFDEGRNLTLASAITNIFNLRLDAKNEVEVEVDSEGRPVLDEAGLKIPVLDANGQPIPKPNLMQLIYKLILNCGYGKCAQKEYAKSTECVTAHNVAKRLDKAFDNIFSVHFDDATGSALVTTIKPKPEHKNMVHCASEILAMSKTIMLEVFEIAYDLKVPIFYTDTDSIHIARDGMPRVIAEYHRRYGKDLIGDGLGQFHSDYEIPKDGVKKDHPEFFEPYSAVSIYLGKKAYFNKVAYRAYIDKKANTTEIRYFEHIRMKGITEAAIREAAQTRNISVEQLYLLLTTGETVTFNLLAGGRPCFRYNKDFTVYSKPEFPRRLKFNYPPGEVIVFEEYEESEGDEESEDDEEISQLHNY